jgi:hypothetical protein
MKKKEKKDAASGRKVIDLKKFEEGLTVMSS